MKRVLLLLPTTSYRNEAFIAAGKKVGVEMITAADYCHRLAPGWGLDPIRAVHFDRPGEALDVVLRSLKHKPDAVLISGDLPWHGGTASDYAEFRSETEKWRSQQLRSRRRSVLSPLC